MIRGLCLPNETLYFDERIQKLVLDKFSGILFAGVQQGYKFYAQNKSKLSWSLSLNGSIIDNQLRAYYDEPLSTPNRDNILPNSMFDKMIIGESNLNIFTELLSRYSTKCSITYTGYRRFLFRLPLLGNITIPFTNQIVTWEKSEKYYPDRFVMCWINIPKNKSDYSSLKLWALNRNKEIWYYIEPSMSLDEVIKALEAL